MIIMLDLPPDEELAAIFASLSPDAIDFIAEALETNAEFGIVETHDTEAWELIEEINEVAEIEGYEPFVVLNPVTIH